MRVLNQCKENFVCRTALLDTESITSEQAIHEPPGLMLPALCLVQAYALLIVVDFHRTTASCKLSNSVHALYADYSQQTSVDVPQRPLPSLRFEGREKKMVPPPSETAKRKLPQTCTFVAIVWYAGKYCWNARRY